MFRAYKYLYYKLYLWLLSAHGKGDLPEFNAMLGVTLLVYFNIVSILVLIEGITGHTIFIFSNLPKALLWTMALLMIAIHYFLLFHGGKYIKIFKEFEKEPKNENNGIVIFYIVFSILMLPLSAYLAY